MELTEKESERIEAMIVYLINKRHKPLLDKSGAYGLSRFRELVNF